MKYTTSALALAAALGLATAVSAQDNTSQSTTTPSAPAASNDAQSGASGSMTGSGDTAAQSDTAGSGSNTTAKSDSESAGSDSSSTAQTDTESTGSDSSSTAQTDSATDTESGSSSTAMEQDTTAPSAETATADDSAAGATGDGRIPSQPADTVLASELIGSTVYTGTDETVGDINDLIVGKDGQIEGVVIGVGGFLGIGEKDVAVEMNKLQFQTAPAGGTGAEGTGATDGGMRLTLQMSRSELEEAPAFETAESSGALPDATQPSGMSGGTGTPPAAVPPSDSGSSSSTTTGDTQ